jgi:hypothetical protein
MDSDDSDEWATDELPPIPTPTSATSKEQGSDEQQQADDESYWEIQPTPIPIEKAPAATKPSRENENEGQPMLLVDMTELSKGSIHSKFDANAVNDPVAVKALRVSIEKNYQAYVSNTTLVANRTVIPCGSTVWRPALVQMRQEKPGHYFGPIFPPKSM